jgi:UDP-GlcNAc:undecaprenyl-phosphate GlcNAc-1-phosphate transferase
MNIIIPSFASFLLTACIAPSVIRCAKACNCLDTPGGRRLHKDITPRWGGIAFFAGVLPFMWIENDSGTLTAYIIASCLLIGMGMLDDLRSLGWKTKFAVMTAATTIVIFGGNLTIHHIGTYGSLGRVELGWLSIPFTYISIIGITNAINLLDGLNGLAGGVSLLGFLFMGIAALITGNIMIAVVCFAFVGALGAFLLYNFPHAKIFMGDTGSLFLGFSLAIMAVLLTQDAASSIDTMFPALVLIIPIVDTLRVLTVRLLNGKNPFKADTIHLHYLLVQQNISPVIVTLLFWLTTAIFGGIALALTNMTSLPYLATLLSVSLFLGLVANGLMQKVPPPRGEERHETPSTTGMPAYTVGYTQFDNDNPGLVQKGGIIMTLKLLLIVGVVVLTAQMVTGETPVVTGGQGVQGAEPAPATTDTLSKRNQAVIKQAEAAKNRNNNAKAKLSKTNKAKIRQTEAAKKKRDLIKKTNAGSTPK